MIKRRQLMLGIALAATLAASIWVAGEENVDVVEVVVHPATSTANSNSDKVTATKTALLEPRSWEGNADSDLFPIPIKPIPKIEVPIQQIQVILPPPKPVAPALPFVYIGKIVEEGKLTIFVSKADKNFSLKGGEIIENTYAVKVVEPNRIVFNYMPLSTEQTLFIGGPN